MAVETKAGVHAAQTSETLRIDLLFLDLSTCTRCLGADRNLVAALEVVREVLEATGVEVVVGKILVESAEHARALGFVSSPTIRVAGVDVALELRESACGSEVCTDGCGDQIACRVWVHRGQEYTEPPIAMIVDAILGQDRVIAWRRHLHRNPRRRSQSTTRQRSWSQHSSRWGVEVSRDCDVVLFDEKHTFDRRRTWVAPGHSHARL